MQNICLNFEDQKNFKVNEFNFNYPWKITKFDFKKNLFEI